jgi:hypothetical protein
LEDCPRRMPVRASGLAGGHALMSQQRLLQGYADDSPDPRPAPGPKPAGLAVTLTWATLERIGLWVLVGLLALCQIRGAGSTPTPAPAPGPDPIVTAAKAWRAAEGPGYQAVAAKIRNGSVTTLAQVEPALTEALLPTSSALKDAVNAALTAAANSNGDLNQVAAAEVMDRAGKAMGGK